MSEEEKEALEILNNTEWDGFMITIKNLIKKQEKEINKLNNVIQNIREEFLKYDWENSTKEQICNQLKSLYESIFMKEDK
jgi:hypothetical protein